MINNIIVKRGDGQFNYEKDNIMSVIDRSLLDESLVNIARRRGAEIFEDEAFVDTWRNNDDIVVKTKKDEYLTRIVVGADGALSFVREKSHLSKNVSYAYTLATFSPVNQDYDTEFDNNSLMLDWSCVDDGIHGYVWHFPCIINDTPFMNHGIYDSRINSSLHRSIIKKVFKKSLEKRGISFSKTSIKSHPVTYFNKNYLLSEKNVILVGDAAGVEPLIGGGIHLSLLYGEIAARSVMSAFEKGDFSMKDYTENVNNHFVGRYINNSIRMARQIYTSKLDLMDSIKANLESIGELGNE
jgi:flavin-dependent dehydrogenase